jgi:6,7-dimethyl-8-ribityllumazine synthase
LETLEGRPIGKGRRVGIACARFNEEVTSRLLDGAVAALRGAGVAEKDLTVVHVPGSFELPLAAQRLARTKRFDAVVALGAVIRGETDHYDYVCLAAEEGTLRVSLDEDIPVMFGVLTCDTDEQAMDRCGGRHGNKGADVALDALRLLDLYSRLDTPRRKSARRASK